MGLELKDVVTDDAMRAPMLLSKELEKLLPTIQSITDKSREMGAALGSATSTEKVKKGISDITEEQKQLLSVQEKVNKENAKHNDLWVASAQALQNAKDKTKELSATSDTYTKSVTAQNASITQLEQALNKNRTAYAALRNDQARNSEEGKKLLSVIQQQAKDQDKLRTSMVQTQHRVGSYNETLERFHQSAERIAPALRKIAPEALEAGEAVGGFGAKLFAIISSPITIGLAAFAVGLGLLAKSVEAYLEDTIEGEERATEATAIWSAVLESVKEKMREIGKAVVDFSQNMAEFLLQSPKTLQFLAGAIPILAPLIDNIVKNSDKILKSSKIGLEIGKLQNDLRREELQLTTELAELTLAKDKAMFEARDKVRNTDTERFEQLRESVKLSKEARELQLKSLALETEIVRKEIEKRGVVVDGTKKAFELLEDKNVVEKVGFKLLEQYATLQAKVFEIEDKRYQGARRRQALENSIINDVIKRTNDANEAIQGSIIKSRESTYNQLVALEEKIVANQNFSIEEQIAASQKLTGAQAGLADLNASKELAAARKAALARIELDSETARAIFDNEEFSLADKVALVEDEKEKLLKVDIAYQSEVTQIQEGAQVKRQQLEKDGGNKTAKIITDNYAYYAKLRKQLLKEDTNAELTELDKRFKNGSINVVAYEKEKLRITQNGAQEAIEIELKEYKESLVNLERYLATKKTITKEESDLLTVLRLQVSDLELAKEEKDAAKKLDIYKRVKAKTIQIVGEIAQSIQGYGDVLYEAELAASQKRIDLLDAEYEKTLKATGDNKNAQAQLERKHTKEIAIETEKQNAIKRRQARFDRTAAEFKIVSSTAAGIAQAFEEFPYPVAAVFSVLIGAMGALQLATLAKAPIPAYAIGVSNHPGGPALVGEKGFELIREPGRKPFIVTLPEVMDLARGAEVLTNQETTAALALAGMQSVDRNDKQVQPIIFNSKEIVDALYKTRPPDYLEQQGELMKYFLKRDGGRRIVRAKWVHE